MPLVAEYSFGEGLLTVLAVFVSCLFTLIAGLSVFLRDVHLSLDALRHEIARDRGEAERVR